MWIGGRCRVVEVVGRSRVVRVGSWCGVEEVGGCRGWGTVCTGVLWVGHFHRHWHFHNNFHRHLHLCVLLTYVVHLLVALLPVGWLLHCMVLRVTPRLVPRGALLRGHMCLRWLARLVHPCVALLLYFCPVLCHLKAA